MKYFFLFVSLLSMGLGYGLRAQTNPIEVHFSVNNAPPGNPVGIRGSLPPLSWETTTWLTDSAGTGVFIADVRLTNTGYNAFLTYKFVTGTDPIWELGSGENRILLLNASVVSTGKLSWNKQELMDKSTLAGLVFPKEELLSEFNIAKEAFRSLHPGLTRYEAIDSFEQNLVRLESQLSKDASLTEVYRYYSRFLASIHCGHTFLNPYNQNALILNVIYGQSDKVPFLFQLIDKRICVTWDGTENGVLPRGTEILAIDGIAVNQIIDSLLPYMRSDGANLGQRLYQIELHGAEQWEPFDAVFPLIFPPTNDSYTLTLKKPGLKAEEVIVAATTVKQRLEYLKKRGFFIPEKDEELWKFEIKTDQLAVLTLATFVTWDMQMDWKNFLANVFKELKERQIPNLVIDIRGNEGGNGEVPEVLAQYLIDKKTILSAPSERLYYEKVSPGIRPYLSTWEDTYFDLTGKLTPTAEGYFLPKKSESKPLVVKPLKSRWQGNAFLLTDDSNSSATFYLAKYLKMTRAATLVGQTTGGNQMGTNGGIMMFLRLPYTGMEMDIPLYGYYPNGKNENGGIAPDMEVSGDWEKVARGVDQEMEEVLEAIRLRKSEK